MFLEALRRRNPRFLQTVAEMALAGTIPPNTYVINLDTVQENARILRDEAERCGLRLYFMTKQYGRNPIVTRAAIRPGRPETVAVCVEEAHALASAGIRLGHVGNLVQIPKHDIRRVLSYGPEVISVFSVSKARQISDTARALGVEQALLIRVADPQRDVYLPGMEAGIPLSELGNVAKEIASLPNVIVHGVTTFPALSYRQVDSVTFTPNFDTLLQAVDILKAAGIEAVQVNAPGNTCALTMQAQAHKGATHVEPGHGLLGTTPFHLLRDDLPETPATCYVTEVAHHFGGRAYVYGGGFFIDDPGWLKPAFARHALVGSSVDELMEHTELFLGTGSGQSGSFGGIDYYGLLDAGPERLPVGAVAIFGFRIQAFVTRAKVAVVAGCERDPRLLGIFDEVGRSLS